MGNRITAVNKPKGKAGTLQLIYLAEVSSDKSDGEGWGRPRAQMAVGESINANLEVISKKDAAICPDKL